MYPIHLLIGNMSLTSLLMAAPQLPIGSRDPISSPSCPRRSATTAMHPTGNKWQHLPRHEVELDHSRDGETMHPAPGSHPKKGRREEDPLVEHLRGAPCREAFFKESDLVQNIRWTYFRAHSPVFHEEVCPWPSQHLWGDGKNDRPHGHQNPPNSGSVMQGKKELHMANHVAKGSTTNPSLFLGGIHPSSHLK